MEALPCGPAAARPDPELAVPTSDPARLPDQRSEERSSFILYVEGPRDRSILRAWAQRLLPDRAPDVLAEAVIMGGRRPARAVEHFRARKEAASLKERLGATFWNWGIPTPASILLADVGLPLVATGGVRSGLDVAKGIALGATMAGMTKPMLEAAKVSADAVVQELRAVIEELKAAMFLTGSTSIAELQDRPVIVSPPTASWLEAGDA